MNRIIVTKKNNIIIRLVTFALAIFMAFAPALQIIAVNDTTAVKKSNYVIKNISVANSELESISRSQAIQALIYLKETYTLREEADAYSKSVATVGTGQTVNIIGVGADSGRNIWYKVRCSANNATFEGYAEREFIACADSRFLTWEDKYVTTLKREEVSNVTDTSDIEAFPESYRDGLYDLKNKHPEWIFVKYNTNLEWNSSVKTEGSGDRSLVYTKGNPASYIEKKYGDGVWSFATDEIIAYYMDPRNFLTESQIFQFELLGYNAKYQPVSAVQKITSGTFMEGNVEGTSTPYASVFVSLGEKYKVSPILQASRIYSEQGKNGSTMISGTYPGYEGLFNYYNIKADGLTQREILVNGLTYAREHGWTTRMAALEGGADFISGNYVSKGQDTYYFQKWNVSNAAAGLYSHQYMQDIAAAYKNANSTYNAYSKSGLMSSSPFVFRIPVYDKMPNERQIKPDAKDEMSLNMELVENLPVDQNAVIVPYINGAVIDGYGYEYTSSNDSVATVDANGVITGVKPGKATITVKSSAGSKACDVNVIKADIAIEDIDIPTIEVTYSPSQRLSDIELPNLFTWLDATTIPVVNNEGYTVNYAPDDSKYNSIVMTLAVTVNKAKVDVTELSVPDDLSAGVDSELSLVKLPEGYVWNDNNEVVSGKAGRYEYLAHYCLDTDNYEVTENISIPVNIICSEHKWSDWSEPTNGKMTRHCSRCDASEELTVEDKVEEKDCVTDGHDMVDGTCSRCGYVEPTIQEHVHEYTGSASTATCTEGGEIVYTCSCGDSYSEPQQKLGHKMNGVKCERCDYELKPTAAVTPVPSTVALKPTPTAAPTKAVEPTPTSVPTVEPTKAIEPSPTSVPTVEPTKVAQPTPKVEPTKVPTVVPTKALPQITKVVIPTPEPTKVVEPTVEPTKVVAQVTNIVEPTSVPTKTIEPTKIIEKVPTTGVTPVVEVEVAEKTNNEEVTSPEPVAPVQIANKVISGISQKLELPLVATEDSNSTTIAKPDTKTEIDNSDKTTLISPTITEDTMTNEELSSVEDKDIDADKKSENVAPAKAVIELVDTTTLNADSLNGLVGDSNNVEVKVGGGVVWDINLAGVDINSIDVDMQVTIGEANIPDKLVNALKSDDVVLMSLAHDGAFGFDAVLNVEIGTEHEGKYANLYYYNPETNKLELVDSVLVTTDGVAAFNMKHASEYVISFSDKQQIAKTGSNVMLIAILAVILLGGIGVIIFVLTNTVMNKNDADGYYDSEDNSL